MCIYIYKPNVWVKTPISIFINEVLQVFRHRDTNKADAASNIDKDDEIERTEKERQMLCKFEEG